MRFLTLAAATLLSAPAYASASGAQMESRTLLPLLGGKGQPDIDSARRAASGFSCPRDMDYCPWTKACACAPGLHLDAGAKRCVGSRMSGPWPRPQPDAYASHGVPLQAYCATSPYRIVTYDEGHEYCQAGLTSIAFVAHASITMELGHFAGRDIDPAAPSLSPDLRSVCAGLAALYVADVTDAVALFNTDAFGLAVPQASVHTGLSLGLLQSLRSVFCILGLTQCHHDCVAYCASGCRNYIDVGAGVSVSVGIGAHLPGLVGLCILPKVVLVANAAHAVVTVGVDGLLCLVGAIFQNLLRLFNCNCA